MVYGLWFNNFMVNNFMVLKKNLKNDWYTYLLFKVTKMGMEKFKIVRLF